VPQGPNPSAPTNRTAVQIFVYIPSFLLTAPNVSVVLFSDILFAGNCFSGIQAFKSHPSPTDPIFGLCFPFLSPLAPLVFFFSTGNLEDHDALPTTSERFIKRPYTRAPEFEPTALSRSQGPLVSATSSLCHYSFCSPFFCHAFYRPAFFSLKPSWASYFLICHSSPIILFVLFCTRPRPCIVLPLRTR